jgi:hypothetical protein
LAKGKRVFQFTRGDLLTRAMSGFSSDFHD